MTDTPVTDDFTLRRALIALGHAQRAEKLLEEARVLFDIIEYDTYAEIPDLEDIQVDAVALTDDIKESIETYTGSKTA